MRDGRTLLTRATGYVGSRLLVRLEEAGGLVRCLTRRPEALSRHLRSRLETRAQLRAHHPQVLEFRASIVIDSGSLFFEMLRALLESLPSPTVVSNHLAWGMLQRW